MSAASSPHRCSSSFEPWLRRRIDGPSIRRWPNRRVLGYRKLATGDIEVLLTGGTRLVVDRIILATGYRADMTKVPYLAASGLVRDLRLRDGFPILAEDFQASVPGLFLPGFPSTQDFGPFFGFLAGATATAHVIVAKLAFRRSELEGVADPRLRREPS